MVSTYAAGSQIPKIQDICACIAATSHGIAEWMSRRDSTHKICLVSDFKCPADCIWSTSKVVNISVADADADPWCVMGRNADAARIQEDVLEK